MTDHNNPFTPGSGLEPPYLAGRNSELDRFSHMLQRIKAGKVENILMYGLRGVGKTVLLNRFANMCMDNEFLPILRLQFSPKYSDPDVFVKTIQHDVDRVVEASSRLDKTRKKIKTIGRYVRPKNVEIPGIISYQPVMICMQMLPLRIRWRII